MRLSPDGKGLAHPRRHAPCHSVPGCRVTKLPAVRPPKMAAAGTGHRATGSRGCLVTGCYRPRAPTFLALGFSSWRTAGLQGQRGDHLASALEPAIFQERGERVVLDPPCISPCSLDLSHESQISNLPRMTTMASTKCM